MTAWKCQVSNVNQGWNQRSVEGFQFSAQWWKVVMYVHAVGDLPAHLGLMVAGRAPLVTMLLVGVATHVLARNTEISVLPSQFCSTHKTALKQ